MYRALLFALMTLASPSLSDTRQFDGILYEEDPNWTIGRVRDDVQVLLSDFPDDVCEFCSLSFARTIPKRGTLNHTVTTNLARFADPEDRARAVPQGRIRDSQMNGRAVAMGSALIGRHIHFVFGFDLGDRVALVGFRAPARDVEDLQEAQTTLSASILPYLETLRFIGPGETLLPEPVPGDLAGAYWGWTLNTRIGLDGLVTSQVQHDVIVFYPDGHFYRGTPPSGLALPNRAARIAAFDARFGTYARTRTGVALTYLNGVKEDLTPDGDTFTRGRTTLRPTEVPTDGHRISGEISSLSYSGFSPGSGLSGGITSATSTRFFLNGRFEGGRFGATFSSSGAGSVSTSQSSTTRGTYTIRDGLLIMSHGDGTTTAELILVTDDGYLIGGLFLD